MNDPTQHPGSSGRDVEAAVREIIRNATESGGTATPTADEPRPAAPVRAAQTTAGNGGTPGPPGQPRLAGPLEAFLRHPFLALLPVVLLVGAALAVGTQRDAEHTAKARVQVGRDNVSAFDLQSVVTGSQALASTYARTVYTEPVVQAAARAAGVPPGEARGDLDASQVGGSTLIEIEARNTSPRVALAMANGAAAEMVDYVDSLTRDTDEAKALFEQYKTAQRRFHVADDRVRRLLGKRRPAQLRRARLAADTARLRAEDLAARYRLSTSQAMASSRLDVIAPAAATSSDRADKLQELVVIGAIAGIVLGLGLALLRSNWNLLRSLRRT